MHAGVRIRMRPDCTTPGHCAIWPDYKYILQIRAQGKARVDMCIGMSRGVGTLSVDDDDVGALEVRVRGEQVGDGPAGDAHRAQVVRCIPTGARNLFLEQPLGGMRDGEPPDGA